MWKIWNRRVERRPRLNRSEEDKERTKKKKRKFEEKEQNIGKCKHKIPEKNGHFYRLRKMSNEQLMNWHAMNFHEYQKLPIKLSLSIDGVPPLSTKRNFLYILPLIEV